MTLSGSQETRAIAIANSRRQFATQIRTGSSLLSAAQIQRLENTRARRVLLQDFLASGATLGLPAGTQARIATMRLLRAQLQAEIATGNSSLTDSQIARLSTALGLRRDVGVYYRGLTEQTDPGGGSEGGDGGTNPGTANNVWQPQSAVAATVRTWDINSISLHSDHPGPMGLLHEISGGGYSRQTVGFSLSGGSRVMNSSAVFSGPADTQVTHVGFWSDGEYRFAKKTLMGTAISSNGNLIIGNASAITPTSGSLQFHDDFEDDIGWNVPHGPRAGGGGTYDPLQLPSKWYYHRELTMEQSIDSGFGRHGGAAMRMLIDPYSDRFGLREIGRITCIFPPSTTVCIRRICKVQENWRFFVPGSVNNLWKQFRLHQTPWTYGAIGDPAYPPDGPVWSGNGETDTGYQVRTLGGDSTIQQVTTTSAWRDDDPTKTGSNNAPSVIYRSAQLNPWGDQQLDGYITNARWVQFDDYFQIGDENQDNGIIANWVDGVRLPLDPARPVSVGYGGQFPITGTGLTTNAKSWWGNPPGFNSYSGFDNYSNMTYGWGEQKYIDTDSVTIFNHLPDDLSL